jgi:hypothetical protein
MVKFMNFFGTLPFGQPVCEVLQSDRDPKDVFVLGVYASAVHARWIDAAGKTVVKALAVASEPYIFWRGDNAESICPPQTNSQAWTVICCVVQCS